MNNNHLDWNKIIVTPTIEIDHTMYIKNPFVHDKRPRCDREQWIAHMVKTNGWVKGAELGLCKGRTFLFLLASCPNLTMVGVDLWAPQPNNTGPETYENSPHEAYESHVRENAKQFGDRAIIVKDWTTKAAQLVEDNSLDFIFVDADHSTEAVKKDILTWWPKVKDTGWIFGHDINWPTVKVVADELLPGYVVGPDNAWGRAKEI